MLDTPTESPETPPYDFVDEQAKLRELTNQSWNLELVISGAALFATLGLASNLDDALTYYRYNLMPDESAFHNGLPLYVVSLCKATCYILFGAFLVNFVMRAYWVAIVGLLAAYPKGIRYDQIATLSQYARQQYARRLGSLSDYIIRLDRRCNVIFALASALAIMLIFIAVSCVLTILIVTGLQWVLPPTTYATVLQIVQYVLLLLAIPYLLIAVAGSTPALRDHPRIAPLSFRLANSTSMPGVSHAFQYITYTFLSNISQKKLNQRMAAIYGLFILVLSVTALVDLVRVKGIDLFDSRAFMSLNGPGSRVQSTAYDNLRPETELTEQATIQADVIREPYVRLFVAYPKLLDEELNKRFKEPVWPDSLKRQERRERRAAWRLNVMNRYFGVLINDSVYRKPDFLFTERPGSNQRGLATVLLPTNLKMGRNTIRLTVPDSANKPETYAQIPFWYVPEN